MRNRKGAVPVIATMLLLTIVVGTVLVVYAYVSGATMLPDTDQHVGKMLEKLKTVEVKGYADGHFDVYITNTGNVDSVIDAFYVKDFLGGTLVAQEVTIPIAVGETTKRIFDAYLLGTSPWSWYEIVGVTNRGNKFTVNLYGFYSGGYELGEAPHEYTAPNGSKIVEVDYPYNVFNVTIDGTPTNQSNLVNLTAVDENCFVYNATSLFSEYTSNCTDSYYFDVNDGNWKKKDPIPALWYADKDTINYEVKLANKTTYVLANFSGNTLNLKYPEIRLNFTYFSQSSLEYNITIRFFDWNLNQYAMPGNNGYLKANSTPVQTMQYNISDIGSNYKNITAIFNSTGLINEQGGWLASIYLITDETPQPNYKFDYFAVSEESDFIHSFETIFWYRVSSVAFIENVTSMIFTTTGTFPLNSISYWFAVFDFNNKCWHYLGQIPGNDISQTAIFQIDYPCSNYIDGTKMVLSRIIPTQDLGSLLQISIDQTRLIVRQLEYRPT